MAQTSKQRRLTRFSDGAARAVITAGGLLMIVSIILIFVLIVGQSLPLWKRGAVRLASTVKPTVAPHVVSIGESEYRDQADVLYADGVVRAIDLVSGAVRAEKPLGEAEGLAVTSGSRTLHGRFVAALSDGSILFATSRWKPSLEGGSRSITLDVTTEKRVKPVKPMEPEISASSPYRLLSGSERDPSGLVALASAGPESLVYVYSSEDDGDGFVDLSKTLEGERVRAVLVPDRSEVLVVGTESGKVLLYDLEHLKEPKKADVVTLDASDPAPITALAALTGGHTYLAGDAKGRLVAYSRLRESPDSDKRILTRVHVYESLPGCVLALAPAARGKLFVATGAHGDLIVPFGTNERTVARVSTPSPLEALFVSPKLDGVLGLSRDGLLSFSLDVPHPEASLRAFFGKIRYEGYDDSGYVWQSSAATEDFEPKLSLVPLIFGTLKGTLYAMLFAIPVALSAALYTAVFAHPSIRAVVKPTVEVMAALPSVVIGFLTGLWLAPVIERNTMAALLLNLVVPAGLLVAASVYQLLPERFRRKRRAGSELALIIPSILVAGLVGVVLAGPVESLFFGGDVKAWLLASAGLRYDSRNCLVIGFAMGLAVVPVIFTISEDALSSVPKHLSAGSLALGATLWQTATRVILPTASAGIFSAVMIGFGRAVGETMIVLMATGNTPIMEWSIFNGMRTLSANIAVEISEAPQGGTLYRTLFLAALILFILTFFVNTAAEVVRQRLRKKYSVI